MNVFAVANAINQKAAEQGRQEFCDPTLSFTNPVHENFLSLWRSKAGTRSMPFKSEMTPRDLKDFLRDIVVGHRVVEHPPSYTCRVIGSNVAAVVGHIAGKTFEQSASFENSARWIEACNLVLDGGKPMRFLGRVQLPGKDYLSAENLWVPLANDEGKPTFVMVLCRYSPRLSEIRKVGKALSPQLDWHLS